MCDIESEIKQKQLRYNYYIVESYDQVLAVINSPWSIRNNWKCVWGDIDEDII